jgi:putative addiction module component (TIGR02574 family)
MDQSSALEELQTLPVDDQLEFLFRAWDRIVDSGWQPEMTPELRAEIKRRLAALEADPSRALSWEEVVASIKQKTDAGR